MSNAIPHLSQSLGEQRNLTRTSPSTSPGCLLMFPPTNLHDDARFPSTVQQITHCTTTLPPSTALPDATHYEAVRTATSVLCEQMLRQRTGLDKRKSEEVRVRMRPLSRLELVWRESEVSMNGSATPLSASEMRVGASMVGEERVQRLFANALRDGYVLCQ